MHSILFDRTGAVIGLAELETVEFASKVFHQVHCNRSEPRIFGRGILSVSVSVSNVAAV